MTLDHATKAENAAPVMREALANALACPRCHGTISVADLTCTACDLTFPTVDGSPLLLLPGHPLRNQLTQPRRSAPANTVTSRVRDSLWWIMPEDRIWSRSSRRAIARALTEAGGSDPRHLVINLGAGIERVWRKTLAGYPAVSRVGLPHMGSVDIYGDMMDFPLANGSVDLLMSSSVMEHVLDPERGVAEMARVVRPGGLVYAEIPFIRSFHMAPTDYQRYTISGIEQLFSRHGFGLVEKGICSGPFNAWALLVFDMLNVSGGRWYTWALSRFVHAIVHPFKYLDRLVERSDRATYQACAFYYLGRRLPAG